MLETRELGGFWWLPTAPKDRVAGKLIFSQADIKLELYGGFQPPVAEAEADDPGNGHPREVTFQQLGADYQPRIMGETRNRRAVTLEECNGRNVSISSAGSPPARMGRA